jgi:hypothetical protein
MNGKTSKTTILYHIQVILCSKFCSKILLKGDSPLKVFSQEGGVGQGRRGLQGLSRRRGGLKPGVLSCKAFDTPEVVAVPRATPIWAASPPRSALL